MKDTEGHPSRQVFPAWLAVIGLAAAALLGWGGQADAATVDVAVTVTEAVAGVTVNGVTAVPNGNVYTATGVPLSWGPNTITATATDAAGNAASASITVHLGARVNVEGTVDASVTDVTVNAVEATVSSGTFSAQVPMTLGVNVITVDAEDAAGNTNQATGQVFLARPPVAHP